jgi:hypothetical protein
LTLDEYVPVAHGVQVRSVVPLPAADSYCPAPHVVCAAHAVAGSPSWSQVPGPQATVGAAPPAQYVPGLQGLHTAGVVAVAAAVSSVPAAHAPAARQLCRLAPEVYVPAAHTSQLRSAVADGVFVT